MTTITLTLDDDLAEFVQAQTAAAGDHASPAEYIRGLIAAERRRTIRKDIAAKVLEGLASPTVPVDEEFWDSIRQTTSGAKSNESIRS